MTFKHVIGISIKMSSLGKNAKVLVTGAGGFIGSHLTEKLVAEGCKVRAFVHYNSQQFWGCLEELPKSILKEVEVFAGDVNDPFCAENAVKGCEYVFHLAALIGIPYSYRAPMSYVDTNIKGTVNFLQASMKENVKKFVHTSTSETYGTAIYTPIDEKHPLQGQSPYSASKIGADKMVESYGQAFNMPVATVRPFNTFGPRQSARAIIPTIISQLASGRNELSLGSLDPVRDLNYVSDTVEGFFQVAASDKTLNQVFNLGSGKAVTIGELAETIIKLMGSKAKIVSDTKRVRPTNSEVMKLIANANKANEVIGWKSKVSLEQGLMNTIEYIKSNLGRYKPESYSV